MTSSSTSCCEISSSARWGAPSSSTSLSAHHDIFLSHSGVQKAFVKDLYKMLSPPYTPFFDIYHHSLPPGENFSKRILDAAKTCKLAVVVLSDDYLLSKWPMIELCAFVNALPKVNILPLFYKLSPENLKHPSNVKKWHKAWKVHAKSDPTKRIVFSDWVQALRHLSSLNGLVFRPSDQGEGSYLEEIVSCIYKQFPLALKYEVWGIQGKERLCEIFGLRQYCFVEVYGHMALRVHDMYLEFAASTPESCMYYVSYGVHEGVEGPSSMQDQLSSAKAASELRAIILELDHDGQERLEFSASLSSVRALIIRNSKSLAKIMGLAGLTSLLSLEIHNCPNLQWNDKATCNGPRGLRRLRLAKKQLDESYKGPMPHELGSKSNIWMQAQQLSARMSTLLSLGKLQPQRPEIGSFASQFRGLQSLTLENTGITRLQGAISMCWPQLQELRIVEPHLEHFELGNLHKLKRFLFSDGGNLPLLRDSESDAPLLKDSKTDGVHTYFASRKAAGKNRALQGEKDLFAGCPDLEDVRIMCSKFCVDTSLSVASKLHTLWIRDFYSSSSFPSLASPLPQSVEMLLISDCDVRNVHFGWRFGSLREVRLLHCPGLVAVTGLEHLPNLSTLEIWKCHDLQTVSGLSGLVSLESLRIIGWSRCYNVSISLNELENLARLREIDCNAHFVDFFNVAKLAGKLEKLRLHCLSPYCDERAGEYYSGSPVDLSALLGMPNPCHTLSCLDSIHKLHLGGLQNLGSLKGVEFLVTLESLFLRDLQQLTSLQGMECLINLQDLRLHNCVKVKTVEGCNAMTRLHTAQFSGCKSLASLPLDFESLRRMAQQSKYTSYLGLEIQGCAFATEDAMVTWALDENVPVPLRVASLRALAWEFHRNLLGKPRERAALLARVGTYFLEHIFQWHEDQQYCLAFAECANELEEQWNCSYALAQEDCTGVHGHRITDEGMRRKVKEATELLRGLAKVPKQQVLQQCRSDSIFQCSVVECIAQLDEHSPYFLSGGVIVSFYMFEKIATYCARFLKLTQEPMTGCHEIKSLQLYAG